VLKNANCAKENACYQRICRHTFAPQLKENTQMLKLKVLLLLALPMFTMGQTPVKLSLDSGFQNFPSREPDFNYSIIFPLRADVLNANPQTFTPSLNNRFYMSLFGPRYKSVSTSNVGYYDFHIGQDINPILTYGNTAYDENNLPPAICACAGVVDEIVDGPDSVMEESGTGRYLTVKCNDTFAVSGWGKVLLAYRHLGSIYGNWQEGDSIFQYDTVGIVGQSGHTETNHLHYSLQKRVNNHTQNVHTMRVMNPNAAPHLYTKMNTEVEIHQLGYWADSAAFRIVIPQNMLATKRITVSYPGEFSREYDFEDMADYDTDVRDQNDFIAGLAFYAYPLNHFQTANYRYEDKKDEMPSAYPASPARGNGNYYPIPNEGLFNTPAYVLDVVVTDLPDEYDISSLELSILSIHGQELSTNGIVYNEAPVVAIDGPVNGLSIQGNAGVSITATASDLDGSIAKLEFYINNVKVGEDVSSPYAYQFAPSAYGVHQLEVKAIDDLGKSTSAYSSFSTYHSLIQVEINQDDDDVEQYGYGKITKGNNDLELGYDGSDRGFQTVGLRFNEVNIAKESPITHAYIQFTSEETDDDYSRVNVRVHDVDSAEEFSYTYYNVSGRVTLSDSVIWEIAPWNATEQNGVDQRTPEMKELIQAIVNRNNWDGDNSISFAIQGIGTRTAYSYDSGNEDDYQPILWIEYTPSMNNMAPEISVSSPNVQGSYPGQVDLSMSASDPDGTIALVNTFVDGQLVNSDHANPFTYNYSGSLGMHEVVFVAYDNEGDSVVAGPLPFSIYHFQTALAIGRGKDDVEEYQSGSVAKNNKDLEMAYDGNSHGNQTVGLRFNGLAIPQGATITRAYIQFVADESDAGACALTVYVNDLDSASEFSYSSYNVSNRSKYGTSIAWNPSPWIEEHAGLVQRTPDLTALVQGIVNRTNWDSDNSLSFVIQGTGARVAYSYDGDAAKAAVLHVEYYHEGTQLKGMTSVFPSANSFSEIAVTVYPNPTSSGMLNIRVQDGQDLKIESLALFNLQGKMVHQREIVENVISQVDVSQFAAGTYILIINTNQGIRRERVIVE